MTDGLRSAPVSPTRLLRESRAARRLQSLHLAAGATAFARLPGALRGLPKAADGRDDSPNTRQKPQQVTAVTRRMSPQDIEDYLQGKEVYVLTKRVRLEVVDFYQTISGVTL